MTIGWQGCEMRLSPIFVATSNYLENSHVVGTSRPKPAAGELSAGGHGVSVMHNNI